MRVISGIYRGRTLRALKGAKLRPMSDQLRETLFDVLGPGVEGSVFLDAYAGTGAVGIEALSRGAKEVVFVEHHRAAVDLIRQNLENLKIVSRFRVMNCEAAQALERLAAEEARFNDIFLAPPYAAIREYHHTLRQLGRLPLLEPEAWVIAEHSRHCVLEDAYGALQRIRLIRHGDAQLAFYRLQ